MYLINQYIKISFPSRTSTLHNRRNLRDVTRVYKNLENSFLFFNAPLLDVCKTASCRRKIRKWQPAGRRMLFIGSQAPNNELCTIRKLLARSQEPTTRPNRERDESSPYHEVLFIWDLFEEYPPIYALIFPAVSFLNFWTNPVYSFIISAMCAVCPGHIIIW
jgi:hypothetical protein